MSITGNAPLLLGQQASAGSAPVVLASDQTSIPVTNAGTFAVQAASTLATETTKVIGTVNISASQTITAAQATASSFNAQVVGDIASGSSDSGNPVKIGNVGKTAQPTAVTDGQRVNLIADKIGRQVVIQGHIRDLISQQQTTITNSTSETTILTQVASTFLDISSLVITNASATAVSVTIKDATSGTTRAIFDIAANGGIVFNPSIPWKQAAVNTNWTATLSVNTVTVHFLAIAVQNI